METRSIRITTVLLVAFLFCISKSDAATYFSRASGNWNSNTTWSTTSGGAAVGVGVFPVAGDIVNIERNFKVTVTATAFCTTLNFNITNTTTLTEVSVNSGITLTVSGAVTFNPSGSANVAYLLSGLGTLTAGSVLVGSNTDPNAGGARTLNVSSTISNFNVSGTFNIRAFRGNNDSRYTLPTFTQTGGILNIDGQITATFENTINSANFILGTNTNLRVSNTTAFPAPAVAGTFTRTFNGTGATVNYDGAAQTILAEDYTNLTISGSASKTTPGGVNVAGIFSIEGTATNSAAVAFGTASTLQFNTASSRTVTDFQWPTTFSGSGGVIITNTGIITMNNAKTTDLDVDLTIESGASLTTNNFQLTFGGDFIRSGTLTAGSSPIVITNTGTQAISGFTTSGQVSMTKSSGTATFTGPVNGGAFVLNGVGTLDLGTFTHTFSGNWTRTNGTIDAGSSILTIGGSVTNTAGTFNAGTGTVVYNGGSAQTLATVTYNNLTLSGTGDKTTTGITVNGILSVEGSGLISTLPTYGSAATLRYNTTTPRTTGPEWEQPFGADGGVIISNTGAITLNATRRLNADLVIDNGATLNTNDFAVRFQSDFTNNGTFNAGFSPIYFVGTINQIVSGFTTTNDIIMDKNDGIATVTGNLNGRDLQIQGTLGVLDLADGLTHTFTRDWRREGGFTHGGTSTISFGRNVVTIAPGSTFVPENGTVIWNGTNQTIAGITYNNVVFSNGGTKTSDGANITINGQLTVEAGVTLDLVATQLLGASLTTSGTGLITTQTTASAIPSGRTWSMEIEYNAAGAQNVIGGTYTNLTTSVSGTKTATGAITVNSVLDVASGVILSMGTNQLLGASLTTSGTGSLITGVTVTNALPNSRTWSMHVEYNSTGNQLVASGTYQGDLTFNGSGISRTMQDDVTVNGVLVLNSGTLVVNGPTEVDNNTLNIMSSVTNSGGTIDASSIDAHVNFGNTSPITIGDLFPTPIEILQISGGSTVTITADEQIGFLLNLSNGKLNISDNVLSILGTISNFSKNNCLIGSKVSNLAIGGSGDMGDSLFFSQSGEGNFLNNFTIIGDVTVHIGDTLKVRGTLTTENSIGEMKTNDYLTIASESTGSGRIYRVNPSFAFTGKVVVERYTKNKVARRYLFITTPVNDISVRDAWQDDIFITGPGTGGVPCGPGTGNGGPTDKYNSNGFDETTLDLVSVYAYSQDSTARWFAPTNTNALLKAGRGYRVLYRGPRGINDAYCDTTINRQNVPMPDSTVMNVTGNIVTGNWTVALDSKTSTSPTALGYTLVGNPYACEISFALLKASNSAMAPTYYTYDPNGPTDTTGYLTVNNGVAAGYHSGGITPYPNPDAIASGQAFFVATDRTIDSVITFMESHKTLTNQPGVFRTSNTDQKIIRVHFSTAAGKLIDNTVIRFNDDPTVTTAENKFWDAVTFNTGNFIAGIKGTRSFAIQTRPLNFTYDTVMVRIVSATQGDFKLNFTDFATFTEAAEIWLLDAFTGAVHNVKADPFYSFGITSNAASQGGRFKLAFRSLISVMPVTFLNISAAKKPQGVEVNWTVAQEQNILTYEVERSRNGRDFTRIAYVASKGNSNVAVDYDFMDTNPLNGNAYYRIKSVEKGSSKHSSIVKVNSSAVTPGISLYPNPVQNQLNISLPNEPVYKGAILTVTDVHGVTVKSMTTTGGTMHIDATGFTNGIYFIIVVTKDGNTIRQKFIKQ